MLKIRNELATEALGVEIVKVGKKYTTVIIPNGELHKVLMRLGVRYAKVVESEYSTLHIMVDRLNREHLTKGSIVFTSEERINVAKWKCPYSD